MELVSLLQRRKENCKLPLIRPPKAQYSILGIHPTHPNLHDPRIVIKIACQWTYPKTGSRQLQKYPIYFGFCLYWNLANIPQPILDGACPALVEIVHERPLIHEYMIKMLS